MLVEPTGDSLALHGFDHATRTVSVGRNKYFSKLPNGKTVEREPQFGSRDFVEWAKDIVQMGGSCDSIERWVVKSSICFVRWTAAFLIIILTPRSLKI